MPTAESSTWMCLKTPSMTEAIHRLNRPLRLIVVLNRLFITLFFRPTSFIMANTQESGLSRRRFLKLSVGACALVSVGGLAGCGGSVSGTASPSIGMQLYSVRHELEEDFEGTIARLAEIGFEGVEFANLRPLGGRAPDDS